MSQRQFRSDDTSAWDDKFGIGNDGALVISVNTTESPIDATCTGTVNQSTLSATNASFAPGQLILIHQTQGTGAGNWELNKIANYSAGTVTLSYPLMNTYGAGAQVRVVPQYTSVTINGGVTYTAKPWNGSTGGILAFFCNGTTTITGTIDASGGSSSAVAIGSGSSAGGTGGGFRGGASAVSTSGQVHSQAGEGTVGAAVTQTTPNGNSGGGAISGNTSGNGGTGGGGAHANAGGNGSYANGTGSAVGQGGNAVGTADLINMNFGGSGGGGAQFDTNTGFLTSGGGAGGGIILIMSVTITITGAVTCNGGNSANGSGNAGAEGGAGSGGSILFKGQNITLGSNLVAANAGTPGSHTFGGGTPTGGAGSVGRIHADVLALANISGTTTPTIDTRADTSLQNLPPAFGFME